MLCPPAPAEGRPPEVAVRVARAQQHKLAAQLQGAVHRMPDQVDALRAQQGINSQGVLP